MALTFTGLLYMQISYMKNMVKMREDQFAEGVKRSLYAVTTSLEQDETKHFLEEDMAMLETSALPTLTASDNKLPERPTIGNEENLDHTAAHYRSMREMLRYQYIYQRGLLNEVILNILNHGSSRPLRERADSAIVSSYLRQELNNNALSLPIECAGDNRSGS